MRNYIVHRSFRNGLQYFRVFMCSQTLSVSYYFIVI